LAEVFLAEEFLPGPRVVQPLETDDDEAQLPSVGRSIAKQLVLHVSPELAFRVVYSPPVYAVECNKQQSQ